MFRFEKILSLWVFVQVYDMHFEGVVLAIISMLWAHVVGIRMADTRMEMDLFWWECHVTYLVGVNVRGWRSKVSTLISLECEHDAVRSDWDSILIGECTVPIAKSNITWNCEYLSLLLPSFRFNVYWTLMYHIFVRNLHRFLVRILRCLATSCWALRVHTWYLGSQNGDKS